MDMAGAGHRQHVPRLGGMGVPVIVGMPMIVGMTVMMVTVGMAMVMAVVVRVRMTVTVRMTMVVAGHRAVAIGPALRIEGRLDGHHPRAEPAHHVLDHVIAADPEAIAHDLRRQMPVPEVPGDANHVVGIAGADLRQRFGGGDHQHDAAVLQLQAGIRDERHGLGEVEQEGRALHALHRHAAAMAVVIIEHDAVDDRGLGKGFRRQDVGGADHGAVVLHRSRRRQPSGLATKGLQEQPSTAGG